MMKISEETHQHFTLNNCVNCHKYVVVGDCQLDVALNLYFYDSDYLCESFDFNLKDWVGEERLNLDSKCLHFEKENSESI